MKKPSNKSYLGIYGNVILPKAYCDNCERTALVRDGRLQCCDKEIDEIPEYYKREIEPEQKRHLPPKKDRDKQLEEQDYRCFYCLRRFDSTVFRKTRAVKLKYVWDHMLPYAFSQNNSATNFVAACQVCNGLKSDMCFKTLDDARLFLNTRWIEKGYKETLEDEEESEGNDEPNNSFNRSAS
jgi:5-methylcytosine-specific restriction endonuclease McrA